MKNHLDDEMELVEESEAIDNYLHALLDDDDFNLLKPADEALPEAEVEEDLTASTEQSIAETTAEGPSIEDSEIESQSEMPVESQEAAEPQDEIEKQGGQVAAEVQPAPPVEEPIAEEVTETETVATEEVLEPENEFTALMFRVMVLKLCFRNSDIEDFSEWEPPKPQRTSTPMILGSLERDGKSYTAIDLAYLVMPENRHHLIPDPLKRGFKHLVWLKDISYAIACDEVLEAFTVTSDEVQWRSDTGKRIWLAGMLSGQKAAMLDIKGLAESIEKLL